MAIDIREIELSEEQKHRIAKLAEQSGRSWKEVLDEQLEAAGETIQMEPHLEYKDRYIRDREKRIAYFREWASRRKSYNPDFDDSRDSIYPDRS
jgi:hypothetical protein